jgi:hypothetical protein
MGIVRDEIGDPLAVRLYRERQAAVIRGMVRSKEKGEPVSGIRVSVQSRDDNSGESGYSPFYYGFEGLSDNDGQFYIQVPERDAYVLYFYDANGLFQRKQMLVSSGEIKDSLQVDLEQITRE